MIADKECAITKRRRESGAAANPYGRRAVVRHINISQDACENCRACTTQTGCPGLTVVDTPLGEKIAVDREVCVDDAYCTRIKACPSFERVTVRRGRRARAEVARGGVPGAPMRDPPPPVVGPSFSIRVPGVGGMGVGVAARVLIEAAAAEWPHVEAYQRKGLAQRGGSVFAEIVMHDGTHPRPAAIAQGELDLAIGLEPLEALRALHGASPTRTAAVVNSASRPTTAMIVGDEELAPDAPARIRSRVRREGALVVDAGAACEAAFGHRRAANVATIGAAYQRGWLPLTRASLEMAIEGVSGPRHAAANLAAFSLGRTLCEVGGDDGRPRALADIVSKETIGIRTRWGRAAYMATMSRAETLGLDDETLRAVAVRLPDLLAWGGRGYAERYLGAVWGLAAATPRLAERVAHNAHRAMAIKDEVFVAHLLTSPKKYARDRGQFRIDVAAGDRISYVHFNRLSLAFGRRRVEIDVRTRDWMLSLFRHGRVLRHLIPGWHRRERDFRDWYVGVVLRAVREGVLTGSAATEAVRLPETVTGFREIRRPKEDGAYARFEELVRLASTTKEGS